MQQLVLAFLLIGALALALKVAVILLIVAFFIMLINRPKEAMGLVILGGIIEGFRAYPLITAGVLGTLLCVSLYFKNKEKAQRAEAEREI